MRIALIIMGSLLLAGCAAPSPPTTPESYDPRLYDARGNVVPPVALAPPPDCREIERMVEIGGKQEKAYGTACRQSDGTWRFVN